MKFSSYAWHAIYHEILEEQEREEPFPGVGGKMDEDEHPVAPPYDPEAADEFAALLVCIHAAIRRLERVDRIIVLASLRGETFQVIGARLGHSYEWARGHYKAALGTLRQILEPMRDAV